MANDVEDALGAKIANPKALGFGIIAIYAWMYTMVWAGWFPAEVFGSETAMDVPTLATYALLVAALASFLRGETWHAVLFMFWSAYAWSVQIQSGGTEAQAYSGWFSLTVVVFHAFLTWGAFQDQEVGNDRALVALGILLALLGYTLAQWGLPSIFLVIGGYIGLLTALLAFWITAQELGAVGDAA